MRSAEIFTQHGKHHGGWIHTVDFPPGFKRETIFCGFLILLSAYKSSFEKERICFPLRVDSFPEGQL